MDKIRALRAEEIECRVGQISQKGCSLLLYKDSRCDKRILDEVFTIYGWKDTYSEIKGNLYCTIFIWDDMKKQWIDKQDCGTESNTEKEKGEASDAFKRACFNLGIGRELYTKIFIWLNVETEEITPKSNKYKLKNPYEKWHVSEMIVDNEAEKITRLIICDSKNKQVFTYDNGKTSAAKSDPPKIDYDKARQDIQLMVCELCGNDSDKMQKSFQVWCKCDNIVQVPQEKLQVLMNTVTKLYKEKQGTTNG